MNEMRLNETPVRTSKNFNINNIKLKNIEIPKNIPQFENLTIIGDPSKTIINQITNDIKLIYGLSEELTNQVKNQANTKIKLDIKSNETTELEFKFDDENFILVDDIEIVANENTKSTIIIKYKSKEDIECYHNGIIRAKTEKNAELNIILVNLRRKKSNKDIEVQGNLKDISKMHFKGTIDFKKGCKKATGNENEACMLLSDTAKSIALPMLLCSEEEVEGNHSSSAGKIGEKELFYIMSRGFELKEAMKLMVRARFNQILEKIENEELREEILQEIDKRLD